MKELGFLSVIYLLNAFVLGTFILVLYSIWTQLIRSARALKYINWLRDSELTTFYVKRYPELMLRKHLVVIHTHEPIALAFGLFQRRIIISSGLTHLLDEKEMEAVLFHEHYHLRHYDPLKTFLLTLGVSTIGYVPILKSILSNYKMVREIMADNDAIKKAGTPVGLGGALLKLLRIGSVNARFQGGVVSSFAADSVVNDRIARILEPDKEPTLRFSGWSLVCSVLVLMTLFAVFNVVPH
ncbi:M56 family metallopeptidase [Paenibacillus sp. Marseille-Q4541]|uniref:M56 family metallopeptidase n=1 Tax=Paenibacillus sp. Marseille-Q4541 TaxID=2831522 RepID=UPI001BA6913D|nr:M56 family metallopeptidase [Paenibacillus sp. Marseille-Q4541]